MTDPDDAPAARLEPTLQPPLAKPHTSAVRLPEQWVVACTSAELRAGKPLARTICGTPLVVFRTRGGVAGALLDRCPHRNAPLSAGAVVGDRLQCGYHGWQFDAEGTCREVPGLAGPLDTSGRARRAPAYATREQDGYVWVYTTPDVTPDKAPMAFPDVGPGYAQVDRQVRAGGTLHATLENALDVPHTAFLHGGLFRTQRRRNPITAVVRRWPDRAEVEFVGEPRPSGVVGRLLSPSGGVVTHFDRYFAPCVAQVEYRIGDENHFLVTTAATPVHDFETILYARIQFRLRIPAALVRPLLEPIAQRIFAQDAHMLALQSRTIARFGGEQFESTEIDLLGPQIYRLLKRIERGEAPEPADTDGPPAFEKTVRFFA